MVLHVLLSMYCVDDNSVDPYQLASGSTLFVRKGTQGLYRLEKYLNLEGLKIKSALKRT